MQHFFVNSGGETKLVLVPANETERHLFQDLTKNELEVNALQEQLNIIGKSLSGGIIIQKKAKTETSDRSSTVVSMNGDLTVQ